MVMTYTRDLYHGDDFNNKMIYLAVKCGLAGMRDVRTLYCTPGFNK